MSETIKNKIESVLTERLKATLVQIEDESAQHAGHRFAKPGQGHYRALIVSPLFEGKSLVERQKAVYDALDDLFEDHIHAFSMKTYAQSEWEKLAQEGK